MTRTALILPALALPGCALIEQFPPPAAGHYDKNETTAVPLMSERPAAAWGQA